VCRKTDDFPVPVTAALIGGLMALPENASGLEQRVPSGRRPLRCYSNPDRYGRRYLRKSLQTAKLDSSQFTYGALLPFELLLVVPLEIFSSVVVFEVSVELSIDRFWIVPVRSAGSF
jgi:hypothetical protein